MSKYLILIAYRIILIEQSQGQIQSCSCPQLLTKADCGRQTICQWNTSEKICQNFSQTTKLPEVQYCYQFIESQSLCAQAYPCSWNGSTCTYFTSCTIYLYDTDEKCQGVSTRCISNGVNCVEKGDCNSYTTQNSLFQQQNLLLLSFIHENANSPICQLANQCSQLPETLNSDSQCREQINKCTASINGGCIVSGVKCEDQISQISCFSNKDQTQDCFWNEGKCKDKICDNASLTLVTDQVCKDFHSTCTTKQGGGCVTRSNCSVAIQSACIIDNDGNDCFWNGQRCVNKTCINALQQYNQYKLLIIFKYLYYQWQWINKLIYEKINFLQLYTQIDYFMKKWIFYEYIHNNDKELLLLIQKLGTFRNQIQKRFWRIVYNFQEFRFFILSFNKSNYLSLELKKIKRHPALQLERQLDYIQKVLGN